MVYYRCHHHLQIDNYNKKYNTKYNYLIPCNLYGEYDKFDSIKGHFVGALLYKIYLAKKYKKNSTNLLLYFFELIFLKYSNLNIKNIKNLVKEFK